MRQKQKQQQLNDASDAEYLKDCILERVKSFQDGTHNFSECVQDLWRVVDDIWTQRGRLAGTAQGRFEATKNGAVPSGLDVLTIRCATAPDKPPVYYIKIAAETARYAEDRLELIADHLGATLTNWSFNC